MAEASKSKLKKWLLDKAVDWKAKEMLNLIVRRDSLADKKVFRNLQDAMGGRVRLMISGSAPISPDVLRLMRAAMGCIIVEGYGATETAAAGTLSLEGDVSPNHVGPPCPCNEVKLINVPAMNYFAKNNQGEVCIRGFNVFKGYYKDPEKTQEALDKDGWFHTGDIGMWTESGTLRLIDRKKHIFKLDQGEYIAPEKIENVYNRTRFVAQSYVHGDTMRSYLVGIVVPDPEVLPKVAEEELGIKLPFHELCKNQKVKKMIHDDMLMEGNKAGLSSFEQVKRIELDYKPFSVENGLLTPTLKSKRASLSEYYKNELTEMYEER
uniref:long-chain-fatty-acid--CoA ligase n=1 Tax=Romanomermis culicivorax TaxID=13658 RepID=A0A915JXK1_ROMCU